VTTRETVWLSPGVPFIVPVFLGLVVALTYGDLLFGLLRALGVA
jgi:preflagellin peptidase FlaK